MAEGKQNLRLVEDDSDFEWSHGSNSDEEESVCVEQQFTVEEKKDPLLPVKVLKIIKPNEYIVKLQSSIAPTPPEAMEVDLSQRFYESKRKETLVKGEKIRKLPKYTPVVASTLTMEDTDLDQEGVNSDENGNHDDYETIGHFVRGTILSVTEDAYEIFLTDFGKIMKFSPFEVAILTDEALLSVPATCAIVTIPGLAPRRRLDHIPGLARMNCRATEWSAAAKTDVETLLSEQKSIFCKRLKSKSLDIWYGDFYGSQVKNPSESELSGLLSSYLIERGHAFMDHELLRQICEG